MVKEYRYELKYVISKQVAEILKKQLSVVMQRDAHSVCEEYSYFIRSIYFDDPYASAYYEKINGDQFRHKFRIRMYNMDDNIIKLEEKIKDNNMTLKKEATINKEVAQTLIDGQYDKIGTKNEFVKRFILEAKQKHLKASTIVDYKRTAFIYPLSEVRVTFDEELRSGRYSNDFFNERNYTQPIYPEGMLVMEVKFNEFLPETIAMIISALPANRQAVSKFALCHSIK